jgi:hypothetical protein
VYRRDGGWRIRAVGQGWTDGLAGLARDFGIDAAIPPEDRQVKAARADPENFFVYVVDNVARADEGRMRVRVIHGDVLAEILDRSKPVLTYWPTPRVGEYDKSMLLGQS